MYKDEFEGRITEGRPLVNHRWDGVLISGAETDGELLDLAKKTCERCPEGKCHLRCPFQMLGGLTRISRDYLLERMDRNALLQLFAMEQACRIEAQTFLDPFGDLEEDPDGEPDLQRG